MAKVSKINISITGDSSGLAKATDAATRELRRLEAQSDRTKKRLGDSKATVNQTAEALAKLGMQSKLLGAAGGLLGLGQVAGSGLGMTAITLGALAAGATTAYTTAAGVVDVAERARKAIEETTNDQRKRIQDTGFSRELAQAIANSLPASKSAAQNLGIVDSFQAGLASSRGFAQASNLVTNALPATATMLGAAVTGNGSRGVNLAAAQMMTGDQVQDALTAMQVAQMSNTPGGPLAYLLQLMWGD